MNIKSIFSRFSQLVVGSLLFLAVSATTNATVIYNWVCDSADCNGDSGFASSIVITDSAFAAGDFTGIVGNVLGWNTVSDAFGGLALDLEDILSRDGNSADDENLHLVLSDDKLEISILEDISDGTDIIFYNLLVGGVSFHEGENYTATTYAADYSNMTQHIQGRFVKSAVPEPSIIWLLGSGLALIGFARRKKA